MKRLIKKVSMIIILFIFGYYKNGEMYRRSGYGNMSQIWFSDYNGKETIHGLGDLTSFAIPFEASLWKFIKFVRRCKQSSYFDMWEW
jgi:hypothetical protein